MRDNGNFKSVGIWENHMPKHYQKPSPQDSVALKEQFIRAKYERKEFSTESKNGLFSYTTFHLPIDVDVKEGITFKEGFLTKKGNVVKNWKRRWFVLNGTVLSYYKKPKVLFISYIFIHDKDDFPAGQILVKDATHVDCLSESLDNKSFCFVVKTPQREFYISADSGLSLFQLL